MCVLGLRCSCLRFAWNRHLHSRKHSWGCPGRRRAGFPSHLSSELCMTGPRPQIHRSRQERLCAFFLLAGCVASHLVLLPGSSSSCTEDRKKQNAYARSRPPADRAQTGIHQSTMPGTRVQVGTAPFAHSSWQHQLFERSDVSMCSVQDCFKSNELGRVGVPHKCGRPGSTPHPKERAAINQKPFSRFSWGARVAAVVLRSNMQKPKRTALQPGHLSVLTARV